MSSAKIDEATVRKVAQLARLALSDEEAARMRAQLDAILGYVASLDALDVRDVEPTFHAVPMDAPLRADVVRDSVSRDELLAAAPKSEAGGFAVPRVLEGE